MVCFPYDSFETTVERFITEVAPRRMRRPVIYTIDGETNFTVAGRLMDAAIPGKVTVKRLPHR